MANNAQAFPLYCLESTGIGPEATFTCNTAYWYAKGQPMYNDK